MTIRMTMTAIALGTMTLAGCATKESAPMYNEPMATPAAAPSAPGAVTQRAASNLTEAEAMVDDNMVITSETRMVNESAMMDPYTRATNRSATGLTEAEAAINDNMVFRNPGDMPSGNDSSLMDPYSAATTRSATGLTQEEAMINDNMVMQQGSAVGGNDSSLMDPYTTANDTTAAAATPLGGNQGAMDACFAAGGQVVGWVGDPTGAEQACRREDGLEYRLADAQYYQ